MWEVLAGSPHRRPTSFDPVGQSVPRKACPHHHQNACSRLQETWCLDAAINTAGVLLDVPLAEAAARLADCALEELDARMRAITNGVVDTASKVEKLKQWVEAEGAKLPRRPSKKKDNKTGETREVWGPKLQESDIERLLLGNLSPPVREALEIRLQAAQTAATKFIRMLETRSSDNRLRNLFRYHGAMTGRWTGALSQVQNLKRRDVLNKDSDIEAAIQAVLTRDYELVKARYGDVLGVLGDLVRSAIIAAPGHRFIVGDFSQIEARVVCWLAGEDWKLAAFGAYDRGEGEDIYVLAVSKTLRLDDPEAALKLRPLGKVIELASAFQMGADKFFSLIRSANIPGTTHLTLYDVKGIVNKWRDEHRAIVRFWAALNSAAMSAVRHPETIIPCGRVRFQMRDGILCMRLPSGREIAYPAPTIKPGRFGWDAVHFTEIEAGRRRNRNMYGGSWCENATQGVARDCLVEALKRVIAAGFAVVLHAHDELVVEAPFGFGSEEELERLMTERPAWAPDLPIAVKTWEGTRFKKG